MTPIPDPNLTKRERQVLDALYQLGAATVAEIMDRLSEPPSYSAVRATLRVLEEKGHVRHKQDGPRYVYLPAVSRERAQTGALRHMLRTFFNGSAEQAVVALLQLESTKLTDADLERLADRIKNARNEGR